MHNAGPVLVVDFGAQYAQLIARRVREAHIYSEIVPHSWSAEQILARRPAAIILSGGPASVFEPGAPRLEADLLEAGVPVLGICYGFQAMAHVLGGEVDRASKGEYGSTSAWLGMSGEGPDAAPADASGGVAAFASGGEPASGRQQERGGERGLPAGKITGKTLEGLLAGSPATQTVWMSHGVAVTRAPAGFEVLASTDGAPVAAFQDRVRRLYGLQWHPEVRHTPLGQSALENFLYREAGLKPNWTPGSIVTEQVAAIRRQVGSARVICGLSGGVDSSVAAALVQRAVGPQLTCVFVDHGLLREGEREQVERDFVAVTGAKLIVHDASARFLAALAGVTDPEAKRKIIGREFIRAFEEAAAAAGATEPAATEPAAADAARRRDTAEASDSAQPIRFLVQGTLYPDVVESGGGEGAATIKSHHNVGGLPEDMEFELVEPLRWLFKDEVRAVGSELGLPDSMVWRQPFPGPGLGIRIVGEVTESRLEIVRRADGIVREELTRAGLDREIWQCPVVLLADVRSVGVQGDGRTYGHPVVLRPVSSDDAMTADFSRLDYDLLSKIAGRITGEVPQVNRVVLDITSKPPGTIEWE
ncbi:MAG: glutamine-hydrolyzing GMP synthase [Bifidobacteriaceae bacterium]|nr:glutamine-hydrolyzing GMP synthase [Bifidobacteriaceae bacterium]